MFHSSDIWVKNGHSQSYLGQ